MKKTKKSAKWGFTLIELMIVVAIIGILAVVAIPKFADLINKSKEGATKGSLGAIRSALTIYYGDVEGNYPTDNLASLVTRYLDEIPVAKIPNYTDSNAVATGTAATYITDAGGWAYVNVSGTSWGDTRVNANSTDTKGNWWTSY